jgi:hypothetical protein
MGHATPQQPPIEPVTSKVVFKFYTKLYFLTSVMFPVICKVSLKYTVAEKKSLQNYRFFFKQTLNSQDFLNNRCRTPVVKFSNVSIQVLGPQPQ